MCKAPGIWQMVYPERLHRIVEVPPSSDIVEEGAWDPLGVICSPPLSLPL